MVLLSWSPFPLKVSGLRFRFRVYRGFTFFCLFDTLTFVVFVTIWGAGRLGHHV